MISPTPEAARSIRSIAFHHDSQTSCLPHAPSIILPAFRSQSAPIPWWLWWNVLSFDAPAVACLWSILLLRSSGVRAPLAVLSALAIAVWLIYTFDRLLDSRPSRNREAFLLPARHSFCARYRLAFMSTALIAGVVLLWICMEHLEARLLRAGLLLGGIVVVYLFCIHAGTPGRSRLIPKEIAVGMIFAAGTSVPLWFLSEGISLQSAAAVFLFGLLCTLNCLAIECWEAIPIPNGGPQPRFWIAWADTHLSQLAVLVAIAAQLASFLPASRELPLLTISAAAVFLLLLNLGRKSFSQEALRVLADAALLVPALLALVFFH